MSLTGGFDFCVELTIEVVREIFHLALKKEERFPHNFGPFDREFSVPGGSPLHAKVLLRLLDDESRPADLRFTGTDELTFTLPFDVDVELQEAPLPELGKLALQLVLDVPGKLRPLPPSPEDGELPLGIDFSEVTPAQVGIVSLSPLPVIDSAALTAAFHQAYEAGQIPHSSTQGDVTLLIYDGMRDTSLSPPNTTGAEIQATLEAGDWVRGVLPIHLQGTQSGVTLDSAGTVTFFRRLVRTPEAIILKVGSVPPPADTAHATQVSLTALPAVDVSLFEAELHAAYTAGTIPHTVTQSGQTVNFYDGTSDPALVPPHPGNPPISATLELESGVTYLHIQIPCWAQAMGFSTFGTLHIHRVVTVTASTVTVDFSSAPGVSGRETKFVMDLPAFDGPLNAQVPQIEAAMDAIGSVSKPSPAGAVTQALAQAIDQAMVGMGDIVQAAPSEARARELVQQEVAAYLKTRRFGVYTPDPGENDVELQQPVGKLLVPEGVLAVQMNRRAGEPEEVPVSFVGDKRLALAVGRAFVLERVEQAIQDTFPDLRPTGRDRIEEITDREAWLTGLSVALADGKLEVSGSATVEVCCWKDPDITFSGPIFIESTLVETPEGCSLDLTVVPGEFDIDQSSCDIFLQVIIPVVGWIVGAVIASTIDSVGGGIIEAVAGSQEEVITPLPAIVIGVAEVRSCLLGVNVRSDGFVFPGRVAVRRDDRSFEDLSDENRQPSGGDG